MSRAEGSSRERTNLIVAAAIAAALLVVGALYGSFMSRAGAGAGAESAFYASWWSWARSCLGSFSVKAPYSPGLLEGPVEAAGVGLLLALAAALALFPLLSRSGRQVLAVGTVTFREFWRSGVLVVPALAAAAVAAGAPQLAYAGGPVGRLRLILAVGLGAATLVGMLLAVALPALTFAREAETRSIYVVASKPVPRWAIFSGKLGGVALVLVAALAIVGAGTCLAVRLAMADEARRSADPERTRLNLAFRRDAFPAPETDPAALRRTLGRGQSRAYVLDVPAEQSRSQWLVLRLHARPANPLMQSAGLQVSAGGEAHKIFVHTGGPVDLPVPASAASGGRLRVELAPATDAEGAWQQILLDERGGVALASSGDGLEVTAAKALLIVWFQMLLVAAVTLAAAGALSMSVAAVTGVAAVLFGSLSGLAAGLLIETAARAGAHGAAGPEAWLTVVVRDAAAGWLSLLPDFEGTGASRFLTEGNCIPWSFVAAGALSLLALRALPAVLVGCLVFRRREVGA